MLLRSFPAALASWPSFLKSIDFLVSSATLSSNFAPSSPENSLSARPLPLPKTPLSVAPIPFCSTCLDAIPTTVCLCKFSFPCFSVISAIFSCNFLLSLIARSSPLNLSGIFVIKPSNFLRRCTNDSVVAFESSAN